MDGVWDRTTPSAVLEARLVAADRMIRRFAPDAVGTDEMVEAAEIARDAAAVAANTPKDGRCSPGTRRCRGRTSRTWCSGTRRPCCASTAATTTSRR